MLETIFVLCICIGVAIFIYDIKRRALQHQQVVNKEKSKIATDTRMTASFAAFSDGNKTTHLLAFSEECNIFVHRKIVKSHCTEEHTLTFTNINAIDLQVNNQTYRSTATSAQSSMNLRATDIARQEVKKFGLNNVKRIKSLILILHHAPEEKEPTNKLAIPLLQATDSSTGLDLQRSLLNALWWQHFLLAFVGKSPNISGNTGSHPSTRG